MLHLDTFCVFGVGHSLFIILAITDSTVVSRSVPNGAAWVRNAYTSLVFYVLNKTELNKSCEEC